MKGEEVLNQGRAGFVFRRTAKIPDIFIISQLLKGSGNFLTLQRGSALGSPKI